MNLSSVLITCKKEKIATLEEEIKKISFCSVELAQDDKIVVIIESENLDEELNAYKKLENLKDIVSINMVFS
ncbi:TPA: chaperone NapD, partial [Campylobacter lari]|nr:chaperone NapD [Campylobacter lari]